MQALVWNCNGAAWKNFLHNVKETINIRKPDILSLVETRISKVQADKVCNKLGFEFWIRVEAFGFSGGIWLF